MNNYITWLLIAISAFLFSTQVLPRLPSLRNINDFKAIIGVETCSNHHVFKADIAAKNLKNILKDRLFGQHLVADGLIREIFMHLDKENPTEPLIISLHGSPGSGKSFTAELVTKALYKRGEKSNFAWFFTASHHFPDPKQVNAYAEYLKNFIKDVVSACPNALFVFDEVDKLAPGLLDSLLPLINYPGRTLDGIDYKKAIYIFLGNSGATQIDEIVLQSKKAGNKRRDLKLSDFHNMLEKQALHGVVMLKEHFKVKWFIPYLPMERRHVLECFRRLARDYPDALMTEDDFEELANQLVYWPQEEKFFSTTGCKRVENILLHEIAAQRYSGIKKNQF